LENYEAAAFQQADNVGFMGDYEMNFGACEYLYWQSREWNTASINAYPVGGMGKLIDKLTKQASNNGVKLHVNQMALTIDESKNGGKYVVTTANKEFRVKKFLFLASPSTKLDASGVEGSVMKNLRKKRPYHRVRGQQVATVSMQWPPGERAWFWDFFDNNGNFSSRLYDDQGCFSRMEIVDTPYHRCHNTIKAVYSDFKCRSMFIDMIHEAERTGNWQKVQDRVMADVRTKAQQFLGLEPEDVPDPIMTIGVIVDNGWHMGTGLYDDISMAEHSAFAANPLNDDDVCLIAEGWHTYYSGWGEGAFRSSRQCLTSRMSGSLLTSLQHIYEDRDNIVPGSGAWDSAFQDVAPADNQRHFSNEQWWPVDYSQASPTDYCKRSKVGLHHYPVA
jgi:hypothetical protein